MTRERYESLSLNTLRELARTRRMKGVLSLRKDALIERMLEEDAKEESAAKTEEQSARAEEPSAGTEAQSARTEEPSAPASRPEEKAAKAQGRKSHSKEASAGRKLRTGERTDRRQKPQEKTESRRPAAENQGRSEQESPRPAQPERAQERPRSAQPERVQERPRPAQPERVQERPRSVQPERVQERPRSVQPERVQEKPAVQPVQSAERILTEEKGDLSALDSGREACGILEVMQDGFGFIRSDNYMPGDNDVYVSPSQIRRFGLKTGDIIRGNTRIRSQNEKFSALLYVRSINDLPPEMAIHRRNFEDLTPVFPNERLRLERPGGSLAMRIVDLVSPIGKGQRGMIVSPPKAGKTTLLKDAAKSILRNDPDMHLIILLIDERPEEVTDIKEDIQGPNVEVIYSTFDEQPEHHRRVSEMVIDRAKRLVEHRKDVTIFIDSITRLARAYNMTVSPSGRTLSGGLDPAALHMPKRFFGAARNMREGGSLTILATALVDTGSKMDDVVYEEFKGTGNMELVLDRKLQERRVFPAIDIIKSGTRREDLLLSAAEQEAIYNMRRALNGLKSEEAVENILNMFARTRNNAELIQILRKQKIV